MRHVWVGTEVASWFGALVGMLIGPKSDDLPQRSAGIRSLPLWSGRPTLSLAARFAFAASVVLCNGMLLLGGWVASRIEDAALKNVANSEALYIQSVLAPLMPELAGGGALSPGSVALVNDLLVEAPIGRQLVDFKIVRADGVVALASDKRLEGTKLAITQPIRDALNGQVSAAISRKLPDPPAGPGRDAPVVRIIHAPLFRDGIDRSRVVGVAIVEEDAGQLKARLDRDRERTWLVVGVSTLAMILLLSGIVLKGSQTIEEQKAALEERVREQTRLSDANIMLRDKLQKANRRSIEFNERFLRRVGSDLHDGPAQSLALALLRLDELKPLAEQAPEAERARPLRALDVVYRATSGALTEIRNISAGLALPELQRISPADAIDMAIRMHERATGTRVARSLAALPARLPLPFTICLYRFVQEALNNAYRHAGGVGQAVRADYNGELVVVEVRDEGPGFAAEALTKSNERLGLNGMRHRVEALGGIFEVHSEIGKGTQLTVRFRSISTSLNREAKKDVLNPDRRH